MRDDDIMEKVVQAEKAATGSTRGVKVLQEYRGQFAVDLTSAGSSPSEMAEALTSTNKSNLRFDSVAIGNGWIAGYATYTAKGANANDIDRRLRKVFGVEADAVAIRSTSVTPVTAS